ncbi:MAG: nucleoside triphosphate pyrophosphohydrolase [Fimbriimonas sp.]
MKIIRLQPDDLPDLVPGLYVFADAAHPAFSSPQPEGVIRLVAGDEVPNDATFVLGSPRRPMYQLAYIVDRLLGPGGCPWDQEQTHESLKQTLLEEAYEVLDAIDSGSPTSLREELGDLLLQPVMHAQMAKAAGEYDINDVAEEITCKLVRRHPHVFGTLEVTDSAEVLRNWDAIKAKEKGEAPRSVLAGIPKGMASLLRAHLVSQRAARNGFEWPDLSAVFDKLHEEEAELQEAIAMGDPEAIESELGDLLFTVVNIARWLKVEPEEALRRMVNRFTARFMAMERMTEQPLRELTPEAWDALWQRAKLEQALLQDVERA